MKTGLRRLCRWVKGCFISPEKEAAHKAENEKQREYRFLISKGVDTQYGYVHLAGMPLIDKAADSKIEIESGVTFVSESKYNPAGINHQTILSTTHPGAVIHIGKGSGMSGATISCAQSVRIGEHVGIGANVCIYDHDFHSLYPYLRRFDNDANTLSAPVQIDDYAWVSANSIVLKGVHIGRGAVIGAGSVVTKDVPELTVWAGNPAKYVKDVELTEEQRAKIFGDK